MAVTKRFEALVEVRVDHDPNFETDSLREGIQAMLTGDFEAGTAIVHDYFRSRVTSEILRETHRQAGLEPDPYGEVRQ